MRLILTFQLLLISLFISAQCPEEDEIILSTQSAVDSFKILYPDCEDYWSTIFVGFETYDPDQHSDIQNLKGLSNLRNVRTLFIRQNKLLKNLWDLQNLEVLLNLQIDFNDSLTEFFGHDSSIQVDYLGISDNKSLQSINCFNNIDEMYWISISDNDSLIRVEGFKLLKYIYLGNLSIFRNNALIDLSGFHNVESITGELFIYENEALENLNGFIGLRNSVYDLFYSYNLVIGGNSNLINLSGLDSLVYAGTVIIESNPRLNDISSLSNLEKIRSFGIHGNESLKYLPSFPNIQNIENSFKASYSSIIELPSFPNIDSIGIISLYKNKNLTNMSGLDSLKKITDYCYIFDNDQLISIEALSNVDTIYGELTVSKNLRLKSLDGLENLNVVGSLNITKNDSLVDLSAICQVYNNDGIEGQIIISENPACNSVEELDSICENVGVENHKSDYFELLISPNPASSEILVQFPEGSILEDWEWKLFTLSGDLIKQGVINNSPETKITGLDNYDPGIYFIHFRSESGRFRVKKLIIL